jgi:hypothetical protein
MRSSCSGYGSVAASLKNEMTILPPPGPYTMPTSFAITGGPSPV